MRNSAVVCIDKSAYGNRLTRVLRLTHRELYCKCGAANQESALQTGFEPRVITKRSFQR